VTLAVLSALVVLVGGYYTVGAITGGAESDLASGDSKRVLDALSRVDNEALASADNDALRRKAFDTLKDAPLEDVFDRLRSKDLADEQREALEKNMRDLMMADMNRKVDEYLDAPADKREEIMDRQLDEWQEFMKKMRDYQEKNKDNPEYKEYQERQRARRNSPTKQERKEWMEGSSPERMGRMFQYWGQMRARAKERGMDLGGDRGDD
jgi:hypothetical protein